MYIFVCIFIVVCKYIFVCIHILVCIYIFVCIYICAGQVRVVESLLSVNKARADGAWGRHNRAQVCVRVCVCACVRVRVCG